MKKIFTIILAFMALTLPMAAKESADSSTPRPIILDFHPDNDNPNPTIHRAPMRICVEAWYDAATSTLSIIYDGEAEGEVALYSDGELIDSSSAINTTFFVSEAGFYTVEITTDSWTAIGNIEI